MTPSTQGIRIFAPLIIALPTTLGTIVIHGVAVLAIVHFVRRQRRLGRAGIRFWGDLIIVSGAILLALLAHLVEIGIWAFVFALCGEFTHLAPAVYHSAVNYTSLGYGDVVMSGPMEIPGTPRNGRWNAHVRRVNRHDLCGNPKAYADEVQFRG